MFFWLKIIEADGDDALIRNKDSGSPGDVFTDGNFGNINSSDGMLIYDNRGRLVSWFASVEFIEGGDYLISISPVIETNIFDVLTPRQPVELLYGESIFVEVNNAIDCDFIINISTNGNSIIQTVELSSGTSMVPIMTISGESMSSGNVIGTLGCGHNLREIDLKWHNVGNRII